MEKIIDTLSVQPLANNNWPPIKIGQSVVVMVGKPNYGWSQEALNARKEPGTYSGKVIAYHDSHGLCYDIEFPDGTISSYDPHEVKAV